MCIREVPQLKREVVMKRSLLLSILALQVRDIKGTAMLLEKIRIM